MSKVNKKIIIHILQIRLRQNMVEYMFKILLPSSFISSFSILFFPPKPFLLYLANNN